MKLQPEALKRMVAELFHRAGCADEEAACIADHLVEANLAGHDSHGVIRVPSYLQWLRDGKVFIGRDLKTLVDSGSLTVLDAQLGFGQWLGKRAVDVGIEKCRQHGLAIVALQNSGHLGRIGHWAELAAAAGFVSLHFVNTSGLGMAVVPFGGIEPRLSINPIAVGFPIKDRTPFILDMAAAATAEGKLKVARNKGVPVPDNWITDHQGRPTNDPNDFYGPPRGCILPFGGHKGYALGLVAELLSGALTGSGCSVEGKTQLEQGMLSIYIDPVKMQTADAYFPEIARYLDFVRTSKTRDPDGEVLIPGDIEERNRAERRPGLELDETTWGQLVESAQSCEVSQELIDAAVMN